MNRSVSMPQSKRYFSDDATGSAATSESCVMIVGSGLIGTNWAMIFASNPTPISMPKSNLMMFSIDRIILHDVDATRLAIAKKTIQQQLKAFWDKGILRTPTLSSQQQREQQKQKQEKNSIETPEWIEQMNRITFCENLDSLPAHVINHTQLVVECVPEVEHVKRATFVKLDALFAESIQAGSQVAFTSSSSCMPASKFIDPAVTSRIAARTLVAHPINPPYLIRLVELVPAPFTNSHTTERVKAILSHVGQVPVLIKKETLGFGLNPLQYAVFHAAIQLVQREVCDVEDVEKIMTEGLAPRWAFFGPWTVAHMNGPGVRDYLAKFESGIGQVVAEQLNCTWDMSAETREQICSQTEAMHANTELSDLTEMRDEKLAALSKIKK